MGGRAVDRVRTCIVGVEPSGLSSWGMHGSEHPDATARQAKPLAGHAGGARGPGLRAVGAELMAEVQSLEAGDRLALIGSPEQVLAALPLFQ